MTFGEEEEYIGNMSGASDILPGKRGRKATVSKGDTFATLHFRPDTNHVSAFHDPTKRQRQNTNQCLNSSRSGKIRDKATSAHVTSPLPFSEMVETRGSYSRSLQKCGSGSEIVLLNTSLIIT